jgi:hypothetical protein
MIQLTIVLVFFFWEVRVVGVIGVIYRFLGFSLDVTVLLLLIRVELAICWVTLTEQRLRGGGGVAMVEIVICCQFLICLLGFLTALWFLWSFFIVCVNPTFPKSSTNTPLNQ